MKRMICSIILAAVTVTCSAVDLITVYQQAYRSSPWLKQRQATWKAQEAAADASRSALFPSVAVTASGAVTHLQDATFQQNTFQVQFTQDIFNLNDWGSWRVAANTAKSQAYTFDDQEQEFIFKIAKRYFDILEAQDLVQFDQAELAFLKRTLVETQHKLEVGLGTETDYKQALANYDAAAAQLIADQNDLEVAYEELQTFTGVRYTHLARLKKTFPFSKPQPSNMAYWVKHATRHNLNLQSQRSLSDASEENVVANVGNQLPIIQAVGTYQHLNNNSGSNALTSLGYNTRNLSTIALQATWNVFAGGALFSSSLQAARAYNAQLYQQRDTYRQVKSTTSQDYLNVLSKISQVHSYREAVLAGEVSVAQFEAMYRVGTETIVNVLDELQKLYQVKQQLSAAEYDYVLDMLKLRRDAGTLTIQSLRSLNAWLTHADDTRQ